MEMLVFLFQLDRLLGEFMNAARSLLGLSRIVGPNDGGAKGVLPSCFAHSPHSRAKIFITSQGSAASASRRRRGGGAPTLLVGRPKCKRGRRIRPAHQLSRSAHKFPFFAAISLARSP